MKEFLSREGEPFEAHNVDEDDRAYDALLARGFRAVPLTIMGDRAIAGFNPVELKAALAAYREARGDRPQSPPDPTRSRTPSA